MNSRTGGGGWWIVRRARSSAVVSVAGADRRRLRVQRSQVGPPRPLAGLLERQRVDGTDDVAERTAAPVVDHPGELGLEGEIRTEPDVPEQRRLAMEVRRIATRVGRAQAHVVQRRRVGLREPAHEHLANVASEIDRVTRLRAPRRCARRGTAPGPGAVGDGRSRPVRRSPGTAPRRRGAPCRRSPPDAITCGSAIASTIELIGEYHTSVASNRSAHSA